MEVNKCDASCEGLREIIYSFEILMLSCRAGEGGVPPSSPEMSMAGGGAAAGSSERCRPRAAARGLAQRRPSRRRPPVRGSPRQSCAPARAHATARALWKEYEMSGGIVAGGFQHTFATHHHHLLVVVF